jgi:hypothetical protein
MATFFSSLRWCDFWYVVVHIQNYQKPFVAICSRFGYFFRISTRHFRSIIVQADTKCANFVICIALWTLWPWKVGQIKNPVNMSFIPFRCTWIKIWRYRAIRWGVIALSIFGFGPLVAKWRIRSDEFYDATFTSSQQIPTQNHQSFRNHRAGGKRMTSGNHWWMPGIFISPHPVGLRGTTRKTTPLYVWGGLNNLPTDWLPESINHCCSVQTSKWDFPRTRNVMEKLICCFH